MLPDLEKQVESLLALPSPQQVSAPSGGTFEGSTGSDWCFYEVEKGKALIICNIQGWTLW